MRSPATAACLLLTLCNSCKPLGAPDPKADERDLRFLIAQYAASIDNADTDLAAEIWHTFPSASFIHPMGYEHGWSDISYNIYRKLMREQFSERKLTTRDLILHLNGDSAWSEFNWNFRAKLKSTGAVIETNGRETQIYQRDPMRRWRLHHVHYSAMPPAAPVR
ncbi:MAG: DUF4440 domain-containing protein [Acidobacteriota bacterium]